MAGLFARQREFADYDAARRSGPTTTPGARRSCRLSWAAPRSRRSGPTTAKIAAIWADYDAMRAILADYDAKIAPILADHDARRAAIWAKMLHRQARRWGNKCYIDMCKRVAADERAAA